MVTIGDRPILWHIMKHYAHCGHKEFYIGLGYKGEVIPLMGTEPMASGQHELLSDTALGFVLPVIGSAFHRSFGTVSVPVLSQLFGGNQTGPRVDYARGNFDEAPRQVLF
jgi:hypothetical protein